MDTLFLTLSTLTILAAIGTIIALIQFILERVPLGYVLAGASLTVGLTCATLVIIAVWKMFGWWTIPIFMLPFAQGALTLWMTSHPEVLDKPFYRIGGRRADLH